MVHRRISLPEIGAFYQTTLLVSLILLSNGCASRGYRGDSAVLLFDGTGTSPNDVKAVETVLSSSGVGYSTADSSMLNKLGEAELRRHRLLIVPGGNFEVMGNNLAASTPANIRAAVRSGLNYLGICAGAFIAGNSPYNGLNLTSGVRFGFYEIERRGIRKAAVPISVAGGAPTLDHYWEDGPELTGWGAVVGKYPDGTPAIVEGTVESGWVILSGVHPEAPANWRRGLTFSSSADADHVYAATLIQAALNRTELSHY